MYTYIGFGLHVYIYRVWVTCVSFTLCHQLMRVNLCPVPCHPERGRVSVRDETRRWKAIRIRSWWWWRKRRRRWMCLLTNHCYYQVFDHGISVCVAVSLQSIRQQMWHCCYFRCTVCSIPCAGESKPIHLRLITPKAYNGCVYLHGVALVIDILSCPSVDPHWHICDTNSMLRGVATSDHVAGVNLSFNTHQISKMMSAIGMCQT